MTRRREPTSEELQWLRENVERATYAAMANRLNVCTDTLQRILVRYKIKSFPSEKFLESNTDFLRHNQRLWNRPCMICKTTDQRPRWQYVCDKCKAEQADTIVVTARVNLHAM